MKTIWAAFLVAGGLLPSQAAFAQQHDVELHAIANFSGTQLAFIEVDKSDYMQRLGEQTKDELRGKPIEIEVAEIDVTNEIVKTEVNGQYYTNSLPVPNRPATVKSWIHLQNLDFKTMMDLYGYFANRTLLLHPRASHEPFSCDITWDTPHPAQLEINKSFAAVLAKQDISAIEDGDQFIQVIPTEMEQSAIIGAKSLPVSSPFPPGSIVFRGVHIYEVIDIYSKLINRQLKGTLPPLESFVFFKAMTPLSKEQVVYAFETIFRWNDVQIVMNNDNTFSVATISK